MRLNFYLRCLDGAACIVLMLVLLCVSVLGQATSSGPVRHVAAQTLTFKLVPKTKRKPRATGKNTFTCLRVQPALTLSESGSLEYKEWEVADWQGNVVMSRKSDKDPVIWNERGEACNVNELLAALSIAEKAGTLSRQKAAAIRIRQAFSNCGVRPASIP